MKKIVAILMAVAMLLAFASCAKTNTNEELSTEADFVEEETSEAAAAGSIADALAEEFMTLAAAGSDALTIAEALAQNAAVAPISPAAMELELEENYLSGFDNYEVLGFDKVIMVAPMMGTIPFVSYVFELSEGTDAAAFVQGLEENANLRWNICTMADEMASATEGNLVFFVMAPASLEG